MPRLAFDYSLDFETIDFRKNPERYRIGKGSAAEIYKIFLAYLKADDCPGADMARKFLQMGWTRARRYANHKGGRKYDRKTGDELPRSRDAEKAAAIFYERYVSARQHRNDVRLKERHIAEHERQGPGA